MITDDIINRYQKEFDTTLPKIQTVFEEDNDSWAYLETKNLFNKNYILHINKSLLTTATIPKFFIKAVIYHELTHIKDSIKLISYNKDDFLILMKTYSEVNAAQCELNVLLKTIDGTKNLNSFIPYSQVCTVGELMKYKFSLTEKDLRNMELNGYTNEIVYNFNSIFCYIGYLKSLKQNQNEINLSLANIKTLFEFELKNFESVFFKDNIDLSEVLSYYKILEMNENAIFYNNLIHRVNK